MIMMMKKYVINHEQQRRITSTTHRHTNGSTHTTGLVCTTGWSCLCDSTIAVVIIPIASDLSELISSKLPSTNIVLPKRIFASCSISSCSTHVSMSHIAAGLQKSHPADARPSDNTYPSEAEWIGFPELMMSISSSKPSIIASKSFQRRVINLFASSSVRYGCVTSNANTNYWAC